jgi:hypothetical protein
VNTKLGDVLLLGLLGAPVIVTTGAVPSTTTVGWTPERLKDGEVGLSISSSVAQVYVLGASAEVAWNTTVSVAPGHSLVSLPLGHFRLIFEFAISAPSATHVETTQPATAFVVA